MKRIPALALVLALLALLPACMKDDCGNGGERLPYFEVYGLEAANVLKVDTSIQSVGYFTFLTDSAAAVNARLFGINLSAMINYHAAAASQNSMPGVAYACSPVPYGNLGSKEIISDLIVTSDADFDPAHPAGTPLTEFFMLSASDQYGHADSLQNLAIPVSAFLAQQPRARRSLQLWLTQRPESTLVHRFRVEYRQTNGEQYILQAPKVTFQ